jgi:SRSO17 transposase
MKKILFTLFPIFVFAQSFILSDIPLPKTYIQNLDPYECNEECLQEYLQKDLIFSFLAHADKRLEDIELNNARNIYISILNLGAFNSGAKLKIAILLPYKKIGKYASSTVNASFAYLITKTNPFTLKSYKIADENASTLQETFQKIQNDGFDYIIAPLTKEGANNLSMITTQATVYFPTLHVKDINSSAPNFLFGAIDYEAQSDKLLQEAVSPLVIFSDKSLIGKKLAHYQEEKFLSMNNERENSFEETLQEEEKKVIKYFISKRTTNLEKYLKENESINNASFFINTPVVKSGMILSQLTLYDTNASNVLSTQINYDPLILSMTQYKDREKMLVANSIIEENDLVTETNSLLGNDVVYDWINYATTIGMDYFYSIITGEQREYKIPLQNNQMLYKIELLQPGYSRFLPYYLRKEGED